jgi:hypothetical protein
MSEPTITIDGVAYAVVAAGYDDEGDVTATVVGPGGQTVTVSEADMTDAEFWAVRSELWYATKFD